MRIAITGATGFLGRPITRHLHAIGWECIAVSRNPARADVPGANRVVTLDELPECDAVLHLAGESVVGLWTPAKRRAILHSRVETTRALIAQMGALPRPPRVFLCASAVGWYGHRPGEILTEDSTPDPTRAFRWQVCDAWERAAAEAEALGCRVTGCHGAACCPCRRDVGDGPQRVANVSGQRTYVPSVATFVTPGPLEGGLTSVVQPHQARCSFTG